jgi:hypothetical protein
MEAEFKECSVCEAKPGSPILCDSCLANRNTITILLERIEELDKEVKVGEALLQERTRVLHAIPACAVHGPDCVPHALDWIDRVKRFTENIRRG